MGIRERKADWGSIKWIAWAFMTSDKDPDTFQSSIARSHVSLLQFPLFFIWVWGSCDEERRIKYLFMFPWWPVGMGSSESIKTIVRYNVPLLLDITPLLYLISLHNLIFSFYTLSVKTHNGYFYFICIYISIYCWKKGNKLLHICMKLLWENTSFILPSRSSISDI